MNENLSLISWTAYILHVNRLGNIIKAEFNNFDSISGVPRGGLIPAIMLSHQLQLKYVDIDKATKKTLIVEDICDTGKSIKQFVEKGFVIAAIYSRYNCVTKPHYCSVIVNDDKWLVFPYENKKLAESDYFKYINSLSRSI